MQDIDHIPEDELGTHGKRAMRDAYNAGRDRRRENMSNPQNDGGPRDDGYDRMSEQEKEEYRRGFRGDDPNPDLAGF